MGKSDRGFTLVELLIVVVLLGILAVISFIVINPQGIKARANEALVNETIAKITYGINSYHSAEENGSYPTCPIMLRILINAHDNCANNYFSLALGDLGMVPFNYMTSGNKACLSSLSPTDSSKSYLWCSTNGNITLVNNTTDCVTNFPC